MELLETRTGYVVQDGVLAKLKRLSYQQVYVKKTCTTIAFAYAQMENQQRKDERWAYSSAVVLVSRMGLQ